MNEGQGQGRPRDRAPEGYVTVREAAEMLGVSQTAVRQRIQRGTFTTAGDHITQTGETRHYIPRSEVEAEARRRTQGAKVEDLAVHDEHARELAEGLSREIIEVILKNREGVMGAVARQEENVVAEFARNRELYTPILEAVMENQRRGQELMQENAAKEKEYQERVVRLMEEGRTDYAPWKVVTGAIVVMLLAAVVGLLVLIYLHLPG